MALQSSRKQHFAVIAFCQTKGGIAFREAKLAAGMKSAVRLAERLAAGGIGAIAFARTGDPEAQVFDDPVEIARFGQVPDDVYEMMVS